MDGRQTRIAAARLFRRLLKAIAFLLLVPLAYFVAALFGALVPANAGWQEPEQGIVIFIRTNGVHTWVMVPKVTEAMDWRNVAPAWHLKDPRYGEGDYVAIGFGNREFYLNTPTWADLSLKTAAAAAVGGGPSLMHVDHAWRPREDDFQKPIRLRADEFARLTRYLVESFDLSGGRSHPLPGRGYGKGDAFYEAVRRYDARRTCNEWTGEALRAAGVRTGIWTPLEPSIMWRFD